MVKSHQSIIEFRGFHQVAELDMELIGTRNLGTWACRLAGRGYHFQSWRAVSRTKRTLAAHTSRQVQVEPLCRRRKQRISMLTVVTWKLRSKAVALVAAAQRCSLTSLPRGMLACEIWAPPAT